MIDVHSHLIYAVDDGSRSLEESIEILRNLSKVGVTDIIITPHYISDSNYDSTKIDNLSKLNKIKRELEDQNIDIRVYLGNEIYIDENIIDYIRENKICTLNNTEYTLIELPMSGIYADYVDIFCSLIDEGCKVVLAHPERYNAFQKDFSKIYELNNIGVLFQCNIESILGKYGKEAKKVIKRMLKEDLVYMFGTDIHHVKSSYDFIDKASNKILKYVSKEKLNDLLVNNAKKIIQ